MCVKAGCKVVGNAKGPQFSERKGAYTLMAKITRRQVSEQFQHFLEELKESFWGDVYAKTRQSWRKFWEAQSLRERDS